jgi:hypothetical protein
MISVVLSVLLTSEDSRAALHLEVLALRHQVQVLQRSRPGRLRLVKTDRWPRAVSTHASASRARVDEFGDAMWTSS